MIAIKRLRRNEEEAQFEVVSRNEANAADQADKGMRQRESIADHLAGIGVIGNPAQLRPYVFNAQRIGTRHGNKCRIEMATDRRRRFRHLPY